MSEQLIIDEGERRYPALNPDVDELTYPRSALRSFVRSAFVEGARWAESQQPSLLTREQIAEVLYRFSGDWRLYRIPWSTQGHKGVRKALLDRADAVLALFQNGADRA